MSLTASLYKLYRYNFYTRWGHLKGGTFLNRKLKELAQRPLERYDGEPQSIFSEDWNNLIILDACTYKLYEQVNGPTPKRVSLGSHSREFIEKTFSTGDYLDCIYVTGNPHFSPESFENNTGRDIEDVFFEVYHTYDTDWDDEKGTILPDPIIRDLLSARRLFPDKRIIAHFMQPHHPFVNYSYDYDLPGGVWGAAELGLLSREQVFEAYKDNLKFVMDKVMEILPELGGKTVITSDHGNLMGENGLYHHPYGSDAKSLREVPWDIVKE